MPLRGRSPKSHKYQHQNNNHHGSHTSGIHHHATTGNISGAVNSSRQQQQKGETMPLLLSGGGGGTMNGTGAGAGGAGGVAKRRMSSSSYWDEHDLNDNKQQHQPAAQHFNNYHLNHGPAANNKNNIMRRFFKGGGSGGGSSSNQQHSHHNNITSHNNFVDGDDDDLDDEQLHGSGGLISHRHPYSFDNNNNNNNSPLRHHHAEPWLVDHRVVRTVSTLSSNDGNDNINTATTTTTGDGTRMKQTQQQQQQRATTAQPARPLLQRGRAGGGGVSNIVMSTTPPRQQQQQQRQRQQQQQLSSSSSFNGNNNNNNRIPPIMGSLRRRRQQQQQQQRQRQQQHDEEEDDDDNDSDDMSVSVQDLLARATNMAPASTRTHPQDPESSFLSSSSNGLVVRTPSLDPPEADGGEEEDTSRHHHDVDGRGEATLAKKMFPSSPNRRLLGDGNDHDDDDDGSEVLLQAVQQAAKKAQRKKRRRQQQHSNSSSNSSMDGISYDENEEEEEEYGGEEKKTDGEEQQETTTTTTRATKRGLIISNRTANNTRQQQEKHHNNLLMTPQSDMVVVTNGSRTTTISTTSTNSDNSGSSISTSANQRQDKKNNNDDDEDGNDDRPSSSFFRQPLSNHDDGRYKVSIAPLSTVASSSAIGGDHDDGDRYRSRHNDDDDNNDEYDDQGTKNEEEEEEDHANNKNNNTSDAFQRRKTRWRTTTGGGKGAVLLTSPSPPRITARTRITATTSRSAAVTAASGLGHDDGHRSNKTTTTVEHHNNNNNEDGVDNSSLRTGGTNLSNTATGYTTSNTTISTNDSPTPTTNNNIRNNKNDGTKDDAKQDGRGRNDSAQDVTRWNETPRQEHEQRQLEDPPTLMTTNTFPLPPPAAAPEEAQENSNNDNTTKALLGRPFGRGSLPATITRKWVVEVSSAEWDAGEQRWKYRILLQRRQLFNNKKQQSKVIGSSNGIHQDKNTNVGTTSDPVQSFTTAFTWRSLADFLWLERALRREYNGGLLAPDLGICLGRQVSDIGQLEGTPVESDRLRCWLSDILNGVRGQGELILDHDAIDIVKSDSMEAFLYKNTGPLALDDAVVEEYGVCRRDGMDAETTDNDTTDGGCRSQHGPLNLSCTDADPGSQQGGGEGSSLVQSLLSIVVPLELCIGPSPLGSSKNETTTTKTTRHGGGHNNKSRNNNTSSSKSSWVDGPRRKLPVDMLAYTSRAIESAVSLDVEDSLIDVPTNGIDPVSSTTLPSSGTLAVHSELIEAERGLCLNYRKTALSAMEKLQALMTEEEKIGLAWKRFSICVANLFSYEKDVENARLGGDSNNKAKRENSPYRKVSKMVVDECLRELARLYVQRATPALEALYVMLAAYVADLSAVDPAVDAYDDAMIRHGLLRDRNAGDSSWRLENDVDDFNDDNVVWGSNSHHNWEDRIRVLASNAIDDVKQTVRTFGSSSTTNDPSMKKKAQRKAAAIRRRQVQESNQRQRLLDNEKLLRRSLTAMCRVTPIRLSRMAWRYWTTEVTQCSSLHAAATALRTRVDIVARTAVSKMIERHMEGDDADDKKEIDLIRRIVNIDSRKRYRSGAAATTSSTDESSGNDESSAADSAAIRLRDDLLAEQREKAMEHARSRVGRWDSTLAMAIMNAVGVDDPNVRVDETTKDLRLVRKYAIGLRENLQRCIEAVELLSEAITGNGDDRRDGPPMEQASWAGKNRIRVYREDFTVALCKLFSGVLVNDHTVGGAFTRKHASVSTSVLSKAGIDIDDPFGWRPTMTTTSSSHRISRSGFTQGLVGDLAVGYVETRDTKTRLLLTSLSSLLDDYTRRVEVVEGFVYMECVGIQLEKYCNERRTTALAAFERKTDIMNAITIATRKRLPKLVNELNSKLEALGSGVSHTAVKETKEVHLESKNLKVELHELAMRRLMRAREASTQMAVLLISQWAKEEESATTNELRSLGEALAALERAVAKEDVDALLYRGTSSSSSGQLEQLHQHRRAEL